MTTSSLTKPNRLASAFGSVYRSREIGVVLALVLLVIVTASRNPLFLFGPDGPRDLLLTPSILVILAIGQAIVLFTRNIDLSVGSILGLTAWMTGRLFIDFPGTPIVAVFVAGAAFGALLGLINGVLVAVAGAPALVVTLGTLYAYRGIDVGWAHSSMINATQMPKEFLAFGVGTVFGVPNLAVVAVIVLVVAAWYVKNKRSGRELYAIGSDPDAAKLYGLRVTRRVLAAFVTCGALAGLAGVLFAARYGTIDSQAGSGLELSAVAAAVVGGVAIFGGSGTLLGAAIGAVLLVTINRALPILGVQDFWQQAVVGVLIIGAIVLDRVLALRRSRKFVEMRESQNE